MPTTRSQAAQKKRETSHASKLGSRTAGIEGNSRSTKTQATRGQKHWIEEGDVEAGRQDETREEPPVKKVKVEDTDGSEHPHVEAEQVGSTVSDSNVKMPEDHPGDHQYQSGTIERGHIYFFYRPKVELEEAHSADDVQRFYILMIPRPPEFSTAPSHLPDRSNILEADVDDQNMAVLSAGADAVPAPQSQTPKKYFRLIVPGKKSLPDPEHGRGRGNVFWGTTVTIGEDLQKLQGGLGAKEYETKTRGTRHQAPARLAARGAYAIVNKEARTPSSRDTHLGYHLSHPTAESWGEVQEALGLRQASSFVLQVKNPLAPPSGPGRVGLPKSRTVDYPPHIMMEVFGKGGSRGKEGFGLRFASVERKEMLDYEGVELLFIAARSGEDGLEQSLGDGRGRALEEMEEREGQAAVEEVFKELAMETDRIPADPLNGQWA